MTEAESQELEMLTWRLVADLPMTTEECDRWSELETRRREGAAS